MLTYTSKFWFFCLLCLALVPQAFANQLAFKAQTQQGFSESRLQEIDKLMQKYIEQKKLVGTLSLVARNGDIVHFEAQGYQNKKDNIPMKKDSIFRIYSMTKPITAVAALTLWEQGQFNMHDPIDKYLPELATDKMRVYLSGEGEKMLTEKLDRPIRIIDLFTHTAGFSYGFSDSEVDKRYQAALQSMNNPSSTDVLQALAKIPLNHQPGTKWHYGFNIDVIGFLVERISGQKLGQYMQETIFEPLGMSDTGFYVKAKDHERFASLYGPDENGKTIAIFNEPLGDFLSDPSTHNGGGGLTSTMSDFYVFAQMLLNGGHYNGTRILGRKTVEYMRSNHLPESLLPYSSTSPGEGYGLAMSVTMHPEQLAYLSSRGNYGWSGAASTYFRIDPKENMLMISFTQFLPIGYHPYYNEFRNTVYQALVD